VNGPADTSAGHEFEVSLRRRDDVEHNRVLLDIRVETTREFSAYGYRIELREAFDAEGRRIDVELGGITLPSMAAASSGRASGTCSIRMPVDGTYALRIGRKQRSADFSMRIIDGIPLPLGNADGGFVKLVE